MMCDGRVSPPLRRVASTADNSFSVRRSATLGLLFVLAWVVSGAGVPLYDGVGFPDEPYRYVHVPAGAKHGPPPKPASASSPVKDGRSTGEITLQSDEQGPQILLQLFPGTVTAPKAAHTVAVNGTPLAPDTAPIDGRVDGNIYRISVVSDAGPGAFGSAVGDSFLYLRAASLKPAPPVMEYRTSATSPWVQLHTVKAGTDVFVISFKGVGDYALVHLKGAKPVGGGPSQETVLLLLLAAFVVVVLAVAILSRRPWRAPPDEFDETAPEPDAS
jgi:hypothetical protein